MVGRYPTPNSYLPITSGNASVRLKCLKYLLEVKNDLSLRFKDYVNNSRKVLLTYPLIHKYLGNDCKNHLRQISKTEQTAKLFCAIANEFDPMVQFMYHIPELNSDGN